MSTTSSRPRPARVVYLVLSHVHPPQVMRLTRALLGGSCESRVVIHHDMRVSSLDVDAVRRLGRADVVSPGIATGYGTFTTCRILLWCLHWIQQRYDYDWVVYLSGQDYPVRPMLGIETDLAATAFDGFLDARPADAASWFLGTERYLYRYYDVGGIPGWSRVRKWLARRERHWAGRDGRMARFHVPADRWGTSLIGVRPIDGPFGADFKCHVGSAWWTLRRSCADCLLETARARPDLERHYRRSLFAPAESYIQSILLNAGRFRLRSDDNLRFIRWTDAASGHPDVLGDGDFETMIASGKHFARKIDGRVTPGLLDQLDRHLQGIEVPRASR